MGVKVIYGSKNLKEIVTELMIKEVSEKLSDLVTEKQ